VSALRTVVKQLSFMFIFNVVMPRVSFSKLSVCLHLNFSGAVGRRLPLKAF